MLLVSACQPSGQLRTEAVKRPTHEAISAAIRAAGDFELLDALGGAGQYVVRSVDFDGLDSHRLWHLLAIRTSQPVGAYLSVGSTGTLLTTGNVAAVAALVRSERALFDHPDLPKQVYELYRDQSRVTRVASVPVPLVRRGEGELWLSMSIESDDDDRVERWTLHVPPEGTPSLEVAR